MNDISEQPSLEKFLKNVIVCTINKLPDVVDDK